MYDPRAADSDARSAAQARTVVDIDLSILGAAEADFDRYEQQIRAEYAWVSDRPFRERRGAILRRFLERPAIYLTPEFRHLEPRARANLARSLSRLREPDRSAPDPGK